MFDITSCNRYQRHAYNYPMTAGQGEMIVIALRFEAILRDHPPRMMAIYDNL